MAAVDTTIALAAGTVLALGAALVVLGPLWSGGGAETADAERGGEPDSATARAEGVSAIEALREIEFDRATGKLSDDDYDTLKAEYTRDALAELRAAQGHPAPATAPANARIAAAPAGDPVEDALRAYRARQAAAHGGARTCPVDGARPESDALFCSACGRFLAGHCPRCGAACDREGQRFCSACGSNLGAAAEPAMAGATA